MTRLFRRLGTPLTVTVTRAAREQAHNKDCGLLRPPPPKKKGGGGGWWIQAALYLPSTQPAP